ncbi:MAG: Re/Si-specific NAD(P)(+) transhydrogenase subunit alpha [Chloroflexi bacterium]|nr:Re/Si-specific NAD(P)(+) transhydrogenase subunit alpha [Chloroflexota bacterium]
MRVGILKETLPGERRVAIVPAVVPSLAKAGLEVLVESGAGAAAGFSDAAYTEHGVRVVASRADVFAQADLLLQVRAAGANPAAGRRDLSLYRPGQAVVGFLEPLGAPDAVLDLARRGVVAFALELLPRVARAQSMDVLSSQATVAGYKGVLLAAEVLPKMFPMLMTAAGTITPARVLVMGAGVAGLQAIAVARRLGALVQGYDVRPAAKEQVESLGAKFVELPLEPGQAEDRGGYARAMGEEFYRKQRELLTRVVAESDVVITTALVPGQRAPVLVTNDMVGSMKPGSVIVDLAAERGGNCEATRPGEVAEAMGVTIVGLTNLASTVPYDASQMYARNITAFVQHVVKGGQLKLDPGDDIVRESLVARDSDVVHPRVRALLGLPSAPDAAQGERRA